MRKNIKNIVEETTFEWWFSVHPAALHYLWDAHKKKELNKIGINKKIVKNKNLLKRILKMHKKKTCGWCQQ